MEVLSRLVVKAMSHGFIRVFKCADEGPETTIWSLWKCRNATIFKGKEVVIDKVVKDIKI
ncbi:hypothetical protein FRX31_009618 [Thalictrum thalictroides]|uniref:Uncharacterized protein n=1 Tax=Thalictrum thalictroides TaxID=46969 RepID=A0A7J6WTQ5_THATH|nr:hypothetical protein FRX31_009618 [Thalictrum thalictroides]